MSGFLQRLGIEAPIIQAPMAGTSTPAMAAAVCEAGGLGSIAVGAVGVEAARAMIAEVRRATDRPFNVNVFCHAPARRDEAREAAWLTRLAGEFALYGAAPPDRLTEIYTSFVADEAMAELLVNARLAVISFHFGLPPAGVIARLKASGALLLSTATCLEEARAARAAGVDAVVAQGWDAGRHRGVFDPDAPDDRLGALELTRMLVASQPLPVIAAGGVMDGAGIARALSAGAAAVQLGTAFIGCPESNADTGYRAALASDAASRTVMTRIISGRPARCLANRFTALDAGGGARPASYPVAYDAGKALNAAAKAKGEYGYGAQWAGQGAPLARSMPAADLMGVLRRELADAWPGG